MNRTPGPWHYQEDSDAYTHIVRGPKGEFLASGPQDSRGTAESNLRLMAASSDLLEACRRMLGEAESGEISIGAIEDCRAAIQKGEGESTRELVAVEIEMTDEQAWQLAQFCKRLLFDDCRRRATSDDEAYEMIAAMNLIRRSLSEKGYTPRMKRGGV